MVSINAIKPMPGAVKVYSLMTYGMPTDRIPVNFNNKVKQSNYQELLRMQSKNTSYTDPEVSSVHFPQEQI
jgi:hypothetical protein